jgi:hypothetical protein
VSPLDLLWLCLIVISLQPPLSAREQAAASGGPSRLTGGLAAGVRRDCGAGLLRSPPDHRAAR